jgi:hypothetical protein
MTDTTVTTTAPPPATTTTTTAPPPAPVWHEGVEAETLGFWQNKGYDITSPLKVAAELTKQYRGLEKHIGAPPDQIVRLPKADAKPEEINAFRQKIGVPAEAKDYDFSSIKDTALADALRAASHEAGVPKDAAVKVAAAVVKHLESTATTNTTLDAAKLAAERLTLEKNWGGKDSTTYQYNHLQAMEGARRLGITPEAVKALESQIGFASVMDSMRKIGAARSEDIFVESAQSGAAGKVTTREGAASRKQEHMADKAWSTRYLAGDVQAKAELLQLNQMIEGEAA